MLNLYTETAFEVKAPTPSSTVHLRIPRKNGSYDKSKFSTDRSNDRTHTRDEKNYVAHVLASQSSFYFRQTKSHPRTFYWSVVGDGRALQIQCADVARSETDTKEAYPTLRFDFQDQILPRGVLCADLNNSAELHVFVCTDKNELFELRLPTSSFRDPRLLSNENIDRWCRPVESSAIGLDTVYRISASSPLLLFISFASGKVQRLKRRTVQDSWEPDNYDDRTWGASIRGLVSRSQLVEYGDIQLDPRTPQAMVTSADENLLFTVCLNHSLRVWHLKKAKLIATKDLLGIARDNQDGARLNPVQDGHLHVFKGEHQKNYTAVTYSPQGGGQFKFWDLHYTSTAESGTIVDRYPGEKLVPPDPDPSGNTVWSMVGFKLAADPEATSAQVWVLWRNHNYHQLYTCQLEFGSIASSWKTNWVKCNATASGKHPPPEFVKGSSEDPASVWLDYFFQPARFSDSSLETALSVYESATGAKVASSQKGVALRQRLSSVVAANASLRKYGEADMDFDRFAIDTDAQWRNFHRIAENINENRNAALSLAYDAFNSMAWISMAGKCCAVRECSKIELLQQNELGQIEDLEEAAARLWPHRKVSADDGEPLLDLAVLINAARTFCTALQPDLAQDLAVAIDEDLSMGAEHVTPTRLLNIYDNVGFGEAVSNNVFERLQADLASMGGISGLNNELFLNVLELLTSKSKKAKSALRNTIFGSLLLSAGVLDQLQAQHQLLSDLLSLVIFVEGELSQDDAKSEVFDASELYDQIAPLLRLCNRNMWLATHSRQVPLEFPGADGHPNTTRQQTSTSADNTRTVTIFEDTLSKAVRPQPAVERPLMYLITDQLAEIDDWASGKDTLDPEDGAVYLQCDMLAQGEYDLATDFLPYQPSTSWSSYVKGRLAVAKGDHDYAGYYFKKASYGLANGKAVGNLVALSAGLLSMIDAEYFNNGLPAYLHHITTLFDTAKAYGQAAHFAHLTLKAIRTDFRDSATNIRNEVLPRLFSVELKMLRFRRAFDALVQLSDPALQRSSTIQLANAILDLDAPICSPECAVRTLQSLPWTMQPALARHLDQHLVSLAKKQPASSTWTVEEGKMDHLAAMHAMRLSQQDYRGAVTVLYDRLKLVRKAGRARGDPRATALRHVLLALINLMSCVSQEEAYILVGIDDHNSTQTEDENDDPESLKMKKRRRVIVTLEDLRKEYQAVLDKCSRIERGDFDFGMDDGEEDESDDEAVPERSMSRINMSRLSESNGFGGGGDMMEL